MPSRPIILVLALIALLAQATDAPAQGLDVSGVPPGPGNAVRGLNGSVLDPSGIGNAARAPSVPPPTITPATPPAASTPVLRDGYRPQRSATIRRSRADLSRLSGKPARIVRREQDRLIRGGVPTICRGC